MYADPATDGELSSLMYTARSWSRHLPSRLVRGSSFTRHRGSTVPNLLLASFSGICVAGQYEETTRFDDAIAESARRGAGPREVEKPGARGRENKNRGNGLKVVRE